MTKMRGAVSDITAVGHHLTRVVLSDMHLPDALTPGENQLSDDDAISGKYGNERNKVSDDQVDHVPDGSVERRQLGDYDAVGSSVTVCEFEDEQKVCIDAEQQRCNSGKGDDQTSTRTHLLAPEWEPNGNETFDRQ